MDTKNMVLIPAGKFLMGYNKKEVYLDSFYMDIYPVTVAEYTLFCQTTGRIMPEPPTWGWIYNHPIVNITWNAAKDYAKWVGKTLPTEKQWEKAARGTDGRLYPWGNEWDESKCWNHINSADQSQPIGQLPAGASPYGCQDMAGLVWEWTSSYHDKARTICGGHYVNENYHYQCASHFNRVSPYLCLNSLGFRCARLV
jgi:formylglycine-generating enzyme required for sulfatase activity